MLLASGKESDFFIDCKQTVLTAEGHRLVGELMLEPLLGASRRPLRLRRGRRRARRLPLASAVAVTSALASRPARRALRAEERPRSHGSRRLIEGGTRLKPGASVALLEDVITTGGSTLKALATLREAGFVVEHVVVLVDRLEGGREALVAAGLQVHAIYTKADVRED